MPATTVGQVQYDVEIKLDTIQGQLSSIDAKLAATGDKGAAAAAKADAAWDKFAKGSLVAVAAAAATAGAAIVTHIGGAIRRVDTLNNSARVFKNLGFGADTIKTSMDDLNASILGLPTSLDDAVRGVQTLAATQGDMQLSVATFKALNDGILAFGGTADMVNGAILQLSQLPMDGPLDAQTWLSLRNNGLTPVFAAIAKDSGVSMAELKEAFGSGQLTVADFTNALIDLDKNGGGGMAALSQQVKDATQGIGTSIANASTAITRGIGNVLEQIGTSNIAALITNIGAAFENALNAAAPLIGLLTNNPVFQSLSVGLLAATAAFVAITAAIKGASLAMIAFRAVLTAVSKHPIIAFLSLLTGLIVGVATAAGFKGLTDSMDDATKSADNTSSAVNNIGDGLNVASGNASDFSKQLSKIADQSKKINEDYRNNLAQLVQGKQENISKLQQTLKEQDKSYQDSYNSRLASFNVSQNKEAQSHDKNVKALQTQIDFLTRYSNQANQQKLSELQFALARENAEYQNQTTLAKGEFDAQTEAAKSEYEARRVENQKKLNEELALLNKHRADVLSVRGVMLLDEIDSLKKQRDAQLASLQQQKNDIVNTLTSAGSIAGKNSAKAFNKAFGAEGIYFDKPTKYDVQKIGGKTYVVPQFATGGFTGTGGKYQEAGIVHKGEYVLPQGMVNQTTGTPDLEKVMAKFSGGAGQTININLSGVFATSKQEQRKIADVIVERINETQRAKGIA